MMLVASQKRRRSVLISVERTGKNQLEPGQDKNAPVLSYCCLLRNTWPKPTGVLENYRVGEINC